MMQQIGPTQKLIKDFEDKVKEQRKTMEETIKGKMRQCEGYLMGIEDFANFMDTAFLGLNSIAMSQDINKEEFVPLDNLLKETVTKRKKK